MGKLVDSDNFKNMIVTIMKSEGYSKEVPALIRLIDTMPVTYVLWNISTYKVNFEER